MQGVYPQVHPVHQVHRDDAPPAAAASSCSSRLLRFATAGFASTSRRLCISLLLHVDPSIPSLDTYAADPIQARCHRAGGAMPWRCRRVVGTARHLCRRPASGQPRAGGPGELTRGRSAKDSRSLSVACVVAAGGGCGSREDAARRAWSLRSPRGVARPRSQQALLDERRVHGRRRRQPGERGRDQASVAAWASASCIGGVFGSITERRWSEQAKHRNS